MDKPVRFSHLRAYGKSALHGHNARFGDEAKETPTMERGTAVHAMLFNTRKVCGYPGATRRGKEYEAYAALHADAEILTMNEYDKTRRIVDAVQSCELALEVLEGEAEQTILFNWMGEPCRSTPDVRGANHITELKTCKSSDPDQFMWHSLRYAYHAQMRMEALATKAHTGKMPTDCFVVAVENTEPYPVTVFRFEGQALEVGERQLMLWMERLKACEASRQWPPYVSSIVPLNVPQQDEPVEFNDEAEDDRPTQENFAHLYGGQP